MTIAQEAKTGTLHAIDSSGDTRTVWDTSKPEEVAAAKTVFDELKQKGYLAYTVEEGGGKDEVIHEFDPQAGAIIMAPQLVGG